MRTWLHGLLLLGLSVLAVTAVEIKLVNILKSLSVGTDTNSRVQDQKDRQRCAGMYSRKGWGGSVDPFILVKFMNKDTNTDPKPVVSMVIFEWTDVDLIGVLPTPEAFQVSYSERVVFIAPNLT